jgi:hypothetical protein
MFTQIVGRNVLLFQTLNKFVVVESRVLIRIKDQTRTKRQGRKVQIDHVDMFLFDVDYDWVFGAIAEELVGELTSEKERDDKR